MSKSTLPAQYWAGTDESYPQALKLHILQFCCARQPSMRDQHPLFQVEYACGESIGTVNVADQDKEAMINIIQKLVKTKLNRLVGIMRIHWTKRKVWIVLEPEFHDKPLFFFRTLEGHSRWVTSVAFSPNGKLFATGSLDRTVKLWSTQDGSLVRTLEGHTASVTSVAFSPNGKLVASGSCDRTVKLWSTQDGSLVRTLKGYSRWVNSVAFTLSGATLIVMTDKEKVEFCFVGPVVEELT